MTMFLSDCMVSDRKDNSVHWQRAPLLGGLGIVIGCWWIMRASMSLGYEEFCGGRVIHKIPSPWDSQSLQDLIV